MVGWGVAGGEGWLGNGGQLEYQRGTNHGGGGSWLTGSRVPQDGMTPLHYAAKYGYAAIVGVLFAAGADKDAETEVSGWGGGEGPLLGSSVWFICVSFVSFYTE